LPFKQRFGKQQLNGARSTFLRKRTHRDGWNEYQKNGGRQIEKGNQISNLRLQQIGVVAHNPQENSGGQQKDRHEHIADNGT
jgi:hypothetical protein